MLSVIIPAKNEIYLERTIRNILENADGEIEVIAELDDWIPDPQIEIKDERVIFVHHPKAIGQRACINHGVSICKGHFIMKLDAHCAVDKGFDVKLAEDCEESWTVVPRMYNLDHETWKPKKHKRTDYMYIGCAENRLLRAEYYTGNEYHRWHKKEQLIDDTMCCIGPGWFMHKSRFLQQEGCDEKHGGWGQQGVEVACKAWLSGGALKVNKKTWFAHWFRGGGGPGFPYKISGKQVERARKYSRDLWINDRWEHATKKFSWLVDKFDPPGWNERKPKALLDAEAKIAKQHAHIKGLVLPLKELYNNLVMYRDRRRNKDRALRRIADMPTFVQKVIDGQKFTDEQLTKETYYDALRCTQKTSHSKAIMLMRDMEKLVASIKKEGIRNPIDMWKSRGSLVIHRGWRRLVIIYLLGYEKICCRVFDSIGMFRNIAPNVKLPNDDSINGIAMRQFQKHQDKATDKYWLHTYTPLYDRHIGHKRNDKVKLLEIGLLRGASLDLWSKAFPKGEIYGVDINDKYKEMSPKDAKVFLGRQEDIDFLKKEVVPNGLYDIIIDDGGHKPTQMKTTFKTLWSALNEKGIYVIEDLYGNYRKKNRKESTIEMLKELIDEMNIEGTIRSMHFYYNICFIEKTTR